MNATKKLAEFVESLSLDQISAEIIELTKNCLIDTLGVSIFGTNTEWGKILISYSLEQTGEGDSTIFGVKGKKAKPLAAAVSNGTCAHGFELDDVHYPSISHPGSVIIPAVLSLGETKNISGKQFLEAVIVGYEIMGRVGSSIAGSHLAKGFHPTGTFGVFGATAACAKVLGLNCEQIQDAFGLAGSFASGSFQFSVTGSMVKRIHAGHAAETGMKAAMLAQKGFTGPREAIEGKYGFCRVFNDNPENVDWVKMLGGLGETYVVQEISVKPSPACGVLHAVVDCIDMINEEKEVTGEQVKEVIVAGHENLATMHNDYQPNSILSAQYSLPFTVGMAIEGKINRFPEYLNQNILNDKNVIASAAKVKTELDDEIEKAYPDKFGAKVTINFVDGTSIERSMSNPKGSVDLPFSTEELEKKFKATTEDYIGAENSQLMLERIASVENMLSIKELFENIY
jgi:2-methylcitrate dehydratase PrpD